MSVLAFYSHLDRAEGTSIIFAGKHLIFWTSSIASFDGQYSIFGSGARASYASLPQCSLFPFSFHSCGPFLYFGSNAASLKWFFSRRCFSWFSLDSKNSDRTPIWIVRLVRSLADRTFQLRLAQAREAQDRAAAAAAAHHEDLAQVKGPGELSEN